MDTVTGMYERGDDGWWVATCPEIPGAVTQGKTLDEARFMLKDAIRELRAARRDKAVREAESREVIVESLSLQSR